MATTPYPRVLAFITPTQLIDGEACLWRLGFSLDPRTADLNRSGPAAALGRAAHEVMSRLGDPLGFETVWKQAISRAADSLKAQWAPAKPPLAENWPGWSLTQVRLRKLWERNPSPPEGTRYRTNENRATQGSAPVPLPWVERWLRHSTMPLAGRPDLVMRAEGELCVVDLKTGLAQSEPSLAQRSQLLFYCELVRSALGELPTAAAVESTREQRFPISVTDEEVQAVVDQAITMLKTLNSACESGLTETLASPSESNCGWCHFRPVCRPFFRAYDQSWPIAHALLFRVDYASSGIHGYEVEATVVLPHWRAGERVHAVGLPFGTEPKVSTAAEI